MNQRLFVVLDISAYEFVQYYQGKVDSVVATTTDGLTVKFPVNILQSFVKNNGVHGMFELVLNEHFKLISISRIDGE